VSTPTVAEPGVYPDLPEVDYHAQTHALSASGAKRLIAPGCPALFKHWLDNPQPPTDAMEFGTATHTELFGVGQGYDVVDAKDWKSRAAQEKRTKIREAGLVPLLRKQHEQVTAMVAAVRAHPTAGALLDGDSGNAEVSLFWADDDTGVLRRCRVDWLTQLANGRTVAVDYKTAESAAPERLPRSFDNFGYHLSAAWYLDGIRALHLDDNEPAAFLHIVQMKTPPYPVTVTELDANALRIGGLQGREAIEIFQRCTETGEWPAWSDEVVPLSLPRWTEREYEETYL
jgi:hypothetical protein